MPRLKPPGKLHARRPPLGKSQDQTPRFPKSYISMDWMSGNRVSRAMFTDPQGPCRTRGHIGVICGSQQCRPSIAWRNHAESSLRFVRKHEPSGASNLASHRTTAHFVNEETEFEVEELALDPLWCWGLVILGLGSLTLGSSKIWGARGGNPCLDLAMLLQISNATLFQGVLQRPEVILEHVPHQSFSGISISPTKEKSRSAVFHTKAQNSEANISRQAPKNPSLEKETSQAVLTGAS